MKDICGFEVRVMGVNNIIFTEEQKAEYKAKLSMELENGENRILRLVKKIGVSKTSIKKFIQQLIDERCNYRTRNRKGCKRKKGI